MIEDGILQALRILVQAGVVYGLFAFAKFMATSDKLAPYKLYIMAVGGALFLAVGSYANSGFVTTNQDPLRGGGDIGVASEHLEEEKTANAISLFLVVGITTCFGVYRGVMARES
jgi:hypothetical protein